MTINHTLAVAGRLGTLCGSSGEQRCMACVALRESNVAWLFGRFCTHKASHFRHFCMLAIMMRAVVPRMCLLVKLCLWPLGSASIALLVGWLFGRATLRGSSGLRRVALQELHTSCHYDSCSSCSAVSRRCCAYLSSRAAYGLLVLVCAVCVCLRCFGLQTAERLLSSSIDAILLFNNQPIYYHSGSVFAGSVSQQSVFSLVFGLLCVQFSGDVA